MSFAIRQIAAAFNQSDARHVEARRARAIFVFKLISVSPARSALTRSVSRASVRGSRIHYLSISSN